MDIPAGFRSLTLPNNPFMQANGPLYGHWNGKQFVLGCRVLERHTNPGATCHGGMITSLADMTLLLGIRMQLPLPQYLVTINLSTDFIAPAQIGDWIEGRAEVLRAGKNLIFAQGHLSVADQLVARINGIFKPAGPVDLHPLIDSLFSD
jgi:uncharacterized protein (TIGR00369 family)